MIIIIGTILTMITLLLLPKDCYKENRKLVLIIVSGYILTLLYLITLKSEGNGYYIRFDAFILMFIVVWMIWRFKNFFIIKHHNFEFEVIYRSMILGVFWYYLVLRKISFNFGIPNWNQVGIILFGTVILIIVELVVNLKLKLFKLDWPKIGFKNSVVMFSYMLCWVALSQEFIFRGLLIGYLSSLQVAPVLALVLSSIIFGSAHIRYAGWKMVILATIAGLVYGLVYLVTNNVIAAVLVHTITNIFWKIFTRKYSK